MDGLYQDFPRVYIILARWLTCGVYIYLLKRRFSAGKTVLISVAGLLMQSSFLLLEGRMQALSWMPLGIVVIGMMYLYLMAACRITALAGIYCCAKAFLLAELATALEWPWHMYLLHIDESAEWVQALFVLLVYGIIFFIAFYIERAIQIEEYLSQITVKECVIAMSVVSVVYIFSSIGFVFLDSQNVNGLDFEKIMIIRVMVDLIGTVVIYVFQSRIREQAVKEEKMLIDAMMQKQYEQYRSYQGSMELINIKYHDLKHQIAGLRAETDTERRREWLDSMEQELEVNELFVETGNPVLDTMLETKILSARKNHIKITYVADGTLLNFMHVTDICSIFGNALDNALESVIMLEDVEQRLIHVVVSARRGFVFIKISNYCGKKENIKRDGLPETTKPDKENHGFGLKSIRHSVQKYGGSVSAEISKEWFELKILIPRAN